MSQGTSSWRGRARAWDTDSGKRRGYVWLTVPEELSRGETVRGVGRFTANGSDDWGRSSSGQGVCGTVKLLRIKERKEASGALGALLAYRRSVIDTFCPKDETDEAGAVLAGLVCGYSSKVKELGVDDDFAACGASHLIAVSGSHLALVSSLLAGALKKTRMTKAAKIALLAAGSGVFVMFCGSPLSALRSWLMSLAAGASELSGRRGHPLSAMSVMGCVIVAADPLATGQMGFILSLLCVGGICLFGKYAEHLLICLFSPSQSLVRPPEWAKPHLRAGSSYAFQALATSLVCQAVSAPVCLPAFGKLSLVAPLANVALGLLFTPLLAAGVVAAGASAFPLAGAAAIAARALSAALIALLRFFAGFPLACVPVDANGTVAWVVCALSAVLLLVFWPEPTRRACVGCLGALAVVAAAYLARWRYFVPASICVMDVGQADAALVRDGASSLMVDAGVDAEVATALARNHVLHLDGIVLTHLDEDHVGGLDDLVGLVSCDQVYVASGVADAMPAELRQTVQNLTGADPVEIAYGDTLRIGGYSARMVWPRAPVDGDENADSVVLSVAYEQGESSLTALLTGDAEKDQLRQVIESGDVGDIDFLKVGHHGSAASIDAEEAAQILPEVSVASAGENNRYGHPRAECIEAMESAGSLFLCTKDEGDVTVRPGSNGPQVSCAKRTLTIE